MRSFKNIANLIKEKRASHARNLSQAELSELLGYKNSQFISNVERGLCSIPMKTMKRISEVLDIEPEILKEVVLRDHEETLAHYLSH